MLKEVIVSENQLILEIEVEGLNQRLKFNRIETRRINEHLKNMLT
jgi:hypothetical protein